MTDSFLAKLVPSSDGGVPIEECDPVVVIARVVEIRTKSQKVESIDKSHQWENITEQFITFEYQKDGCSHFFHQTFQPGDVIPVMGQYVRGVVVGTQWFSSKFVVTHLLKVKEE